MRMMVSGRKICVSSRSSAMSMMILMYLHLSAFSENIVIIANPSKSGGAWWYGKTVKEGRSGLFPSTYVQELENGESSV